jgi:two-component SAPR family response regulator
MSRVSIQLFGQFCVQRNEQLLSGFESNKVQELFCYLLLHQQHALSREFLASLLWLDVAVFERAFNFVQGIPGRELDAQKVQFLQNALHLYRGPLLEGCYSAWCLYERERFRNIYLALLDKLMDYCEGHLDYDAGLLYGMRLHYLNGDRAAALHQYEMCIAALDEELGVKPSKRTVALYKQIMTDQLVEPQPTLPTIESHFALELSAFPQIEMLGHLTQLQKALADLQRQIQQSIQQMEQAFNENLQTLSPKPLR